MDLRKFLLAQGCRGPEGSRAICYMGLVSVLGNHGLNLERLGGLNLGAHMCKIIYTCPCRVRANAQGASLVCSPSVAPVDEPTIGESSTVGAL